jgi:hypothetical protein
MSTEDLEQMGKDLMRALLCYSEIYIPNDLTVLHQML